MAPFDISVIIATFDRPDSLAETLRHLARADRQGLSTDVIVIDNGNDPGTRAAVESARSLLSLRYVHESRPGKEFAVNRGVDQEGLGDIVVFLDDDMSPEKGWWHGVKAICDRHPDCDYFTGRSYIIWPREELPGWARIYAVQSWAHSVLDCGPNDHRFQPGQWPSGNMFWIRRRVIEMGFREDVSLYPRHSMGADAEFILRLAENGMRGVAGPDAAAGHRVQEGLLDLATIRQRALRMGRGLARARLDKPNTLPQARLLRDHPIAFKLLTIANLSRWAASYGLAYLKSTHDARTVQQLLALLGMANNWEVLRMRR